MSNRMVYRSSVVRVVIQRRFCWPVSVVQLLQFVVLVVAAVILVVHVYVSPASTRMLCYSCNTVCSGLCEC